MDATGPLAVAAISLFLLVVGALLDDRRARARRRAAVSAAAEEPPLRHSVDDDHGAPSAALDWLRDDHRWPVHDLSGVLALAPAPTPAPAPVPAPALASAPRLFTHHGAVKHSEITAEMLAVPARPPAHVADSSRPTAQRPPSESSVGDETGEITDVDACPPVPVLPFTPPLGSQPVPSCAPRSGPPPAGLARAPRATPPPPSLSRRPQPGLPSWPVVGASPAPPPSPASSPAPLRSGLTPPTRVLRKRAGG